MPAKAPNLALAAELGRLLEYSLLSCMPNAQAQPTRNRAAVERSAGATCSTFSQFIESGIECRLNLLFLYFWVNLLNVLNCGQIISSLPVLARL